MSVFRDPRSPPPSAISVSYKCDPRENFSSSVVRGTIQWDAGRDKLMGPTHPPSQARNAQFGTRKEREDVVLKYYSEVTSIYDVQETFGLIYSLSLLSAIFVNCLFANLEHFSPPPLPASTFVCTSYIEVPLRRGGDGYKCLFNGQGAAARYVPSRGPGPMPVAVVNREI